MAYVSLVFVERPFRRGLHLIKPWQVVTAGFCARFLVMSAGFSIAGSDGILQRFNRRTKELIVENQARMDENPSDDCLNWRRDVHVVSDIAACPISATGGGKRILFWGDSHVGYLQPLVRHLYDDGLIKNRGAVFAISAGCPPALSLSLIDQSYHCAVFSQLALERARADDIGLVFIGFAGWFTRDDTHFCESTGDHCDTALSHEDVENIFIESLTKILMDLKRRGKIVVMALPAPFYSDAIPDLQTKRLSMGALDSLVGLERRLTREDFLALRQRLVTLASQLDVRVFDPRKDICPGGTCFYEQGGVSIYTDNNHIASSKVDIFRHSLLDALRD